MTIGKNKTPKLSHTLLRKYNKKNVPSNVLDLIENMQGAELTSHITSWAIKNNLSMEGVYSFKKNLSERRIFKRDYRTSYSEWMLNEKIAAYEFASNFGVEVPGVLLSRSSLDQLESVNLRKKVLKPSDGAGSKYVYLIYDNENIFSLMAKEYLTKDQMFHDLRDAVNRRLVKNKFNLEKLITEDEKGTPARDLKFYCFYGFCALILEIVRGEVVKYCFHDREGHIVDTGKYSSSLFAGLGVSQEQIAIAEKISLEIPCPFMRIDFLKSNSNSLGMVFGEFTPAPGFYETFNRETDARLGRLWAKAESALFEDLMKGKRFEAFRRIGKK